MANTGINWPDYCKTCNRMTTHLLTIRNQRPFILCNNCLRPQALHDETDIPQ